MDNSLVDLATKLNNREENAQVWKISESYFSSLGFVFSNIAIINIDNHTVLGAYSNMRQDWIDRYLSKKYHLVDPMMEYLIHAKTSKIWSRQLSNASDPRADVCRIKMLREYHDEFGSFSVLIPFKTVGSNLVVGFNLGSCENSIEFNKFYKSVIDRLYLAAAISEHSIIGSTKDSESWHAMAPAQDKLSPREAEVVRWLANGLRNDRIAEKMSLSNATVNFHIVSAKRRIGVKTREQLVARAIIDQLIDI